MYYGAIHRYDNSFGKFFDWSLGEGEQGGVNFILTRFADRCERTFSSKIFGKTLMKRSVGNVKCQGNGNICLQQDNNSILAMECLTRGINLAKCFDVFRTKPRLSVLAFHMVAFSRYFRQFSKT